MFLAEYQKISRVGKIRDYDEEIEFFWKKNAFIFLKGIFTKNRKARNMPVVAGCPDKVTV